MRIFLVTNFPAPYRVPLFDQLARLPGIDLLVYYSNQTVEGHKWDIPELNHNYRHFSDGYNSFAEAIRFNPDVLIIAGFNKHTLPLFALKIKNKRKISIFTDMWDPLFSNLDRGSQKVRKLIYNQADHFIVPGIKSVQHIRRMVGRNLPEDRIGVIPLTPDPANFPFSSVPPEGKDFDLIFSGKIIEGKLPEFFVKVCTKVNLTNKINVLMLGDGPLKNKIAENLTILKIDHTFAGDVPQARLQSFYKRGRLLLFPTLSDAWGIVANEALSASVPVIISPNAGAADDLVISGKNGFVLDNNAELWAQKAIEILEGKHQFTFDPPPTIESIARKLIDSLEALS